jgi:hypothetical protein
VAVISYSFWERRFDGAKEAIGRTLTLDRVTFTVVASHRRTFLVRMSVAPLMSRCRLATNR